MCCTSHHLCFGLSKEQANNTERLHKKPSKNRIHRREFGTRSMVMPGGDPSRHLADELNRTNNDPDAQFSNKNKRRPMSTGRRFTRESREFLPIFLEKVEGGFVLSLV
jgi:hypothetical protein